MVSKGGNARWMWRAVVVGPAGMLLCLAARTSEGFDPYYPPNTLLRQTIRDLRERQSVRPPDGLESRIREALRSIHEVEGRADATVADRLAAELKAAWLELERARVVGSLGYREFDDEKFGAAESKFEMVIEHFRGMRVPSPSAPYGAQVHALMEVQALSRTARLGVPGLLSDDVLLMREKRHRLLLREPRGDESVLRPGNDAGAPR